MNTLYVEKALAEVFHYKKLPVCASEPFRKFFTDNIPNYLSIDGGTISIYSCKGVLISKGYERIVVGDYGAFIEFKESDANIEKFTVELGQEYRINDPNYSNNVKYHWYTIPDNNNLKIYKQVKTVSYADYLPNMYYVSVHQVYTNKNQVQL